MHEQLEKKLLDISHRRGLNRREQREAIIQLILEARFDELTELGCLYRGSKKAFLDHYEERYKFLKASISTGLKS